MSAVCSGLTLILSPPLEHHKDDRHDHHEPRASVSYSTDPTAQSVRSFVTSSARLESAAPSAPAAPAPLDLARLYPSLFAQPQTVATFATPARATALVASAVGSVAAALIAVLHK